MNKSKDLESAGGYYIVATDRNGNRTESKRVYKKEIEARRVARKLNKIDKDIRYGVLWGEQS